MRKAPGSKSVGPGWRRWRVAIGVAAVAVLLLIGWGGYALQQQAKCEQANAALRAEQERQARLAAEADAKRKADEAERQRREAAAKTEREHQARLAAEADAKRKADEAEL